MTRTLPQIQKTDYREIFAPEIMFPNLRLMLAIVAFGGLEIYRMDVNTAFSNGDLSESICTEQPEGFVTPKTSNRISKLRNGICSL